MAATVLLVEDVTELRTALRLTLRLRGGFEVVAEAGSGEEAIEAARAHQPDIVVLDLGLPDLAGRLVLAGLRAVAPDAQVVVYTGSVTQACSDVAEKVEAFVLKDQGVAYLVDLLADLVARPRHAASIDLTGDRRQVVAARAFIAQQCRRWRCIGSTDDASIVVSELVTNALVHAASGCQLRARRAGELLRIEVSDRGRGTPDPKSADDQAESGRGLLIVSALCVAWGVETYPDGKIVWAELPCRTDVSGGPEPAEENRLAQAPDRQEVTDGRPATPGAGAATRSPRGGSLPAGAGRAKSPPASSGSARRRRWSRPRRGSTSGRGSRRPIRTVP
ncbi:MAG TPA: response regulator [Acidimicrobiales bacterium]|nr:response regulator [Acidimicrobiales bacterium]